MLPRLYRLPMRSRMKPDFSRRTDAFVLKLTANKLPYNRMGIVVAKSIDKRAVVRNATKRAFRECFSSLPANISGYDMLFIARKAVEKEGAERICQLINNELLSVKLQ